MTALEEIELRARIRIMEDRIERQNALASHYHREGQARFFKRTREILVKMHQAVCTMNMDLTMGQEQARNQS
jgi:hypothetical protein